MTLYLCKKQKTDDIDTLKLEGYKLYMKNRNKAGSVSSGGIIFGYRDELAEYIDIIDTNSKFILWTKVSKRLHKLEKDLLVGVVYIPPENSKYSSRDAFDEIELEWMNMNRNQNFVLLTGDFNSRTGIRPDINDIVYDDNEYHINLIRLQPEL